MSNIHSLIVDVYALLKGKGGWFNDALAEEFSASISGRLRSQFNTSDRTPTLRMSQMGPKCPCALWTSIHHPELAEPLPPWATFKYSFGHTIEALAIGLAKAAGHEVTGEQDELKLDGIVGHRDCVIDGYIVDVKSASTFSFNSFRSGSFVDNFGYLDQLDGYVLASKDDPLVRYKDVAFDWVIDKQLGKMCLYEHHTTAEREAILRARVEEYKRIVGLRAAPQCTCGTIADGVSGNVKLDLKASYSPYKYVCKPGLRTFIYAGGPVYLTKVVKRPFNKDGPITEVDRHGNQVYH